MTLFEALTGGAFDGLTGNIAGNLTKIFPKSQMPRGLPGGGWAVLELTGTLLCFQLTRNVRFNGNMYNFKFTYLPWGQLVNLNLDKIFLTLLKILPSYEAFLVT